MARNSLSLPDRVVQLLSAADARGGFPAGTMLSLMQQEAGGQIDRFLADPAAAHYPSGVAPSGVRSSAFGPFGILASTAADPGYGVTPLKDRSLDEQVRFSTDYLSALVRQTGSLQAALGRYGEGKKYADQVMGRVTPQPSSPAAAPAPSPVVVAPVPAVMPAPADPSKDPWTQFVRETQQLMTDRMNTGLKYGSAAPATPAPAPTEQELRNAQFAQMMDDIPLNAQPNFGAFRGLLHLGRKVA